MKTRKRKSLLGTFQRKVLILLFAMVFVPGIVGVTLTYFKVYRDDINRLKRGDKEAAKIISTLVSSKIENYCLYLKDVVRENRNYNMEASKNGNLPPKKITIYLQKHYLSKNFSFVTNIIYTNNNFIVRRFQKDPSIIILNYLKNNLRNYTFEHKDKFVLTPILKIGDKLVTFLILPIDNVIKNENADFHKFNYLISVLDVQGLLNSNFHSLLEDNENANLYLKCSHENIFKIGFDWKFTSFSEVSDGDLYRIYLTKTHRLLSDLDKNTSVANEDLIFSEIDVSYFKSPWSSIVITNTGNVWKDSLGNVLNIIWFGFLVALLIGVGASFYFKKRIIAPIKSLTNDIDSLMDSEKEGAISKYCDGDVIYSLSKTIESLIKFKTEELKNNNEFFKQILNRINVGILVYENNNTHKIRSYNNYIRENFCISENKNHCLQKGFNMPCDKCTGVIELINNDNIQAKAGIENNKGRIYERIRSELSHNENNFTLMVFYDITELKKKEEKLLEEKEIFETLFNGITDPLALFRVDGEMLKSNKEAIKLLGTYEKQSKFGLVKFLLINETVKKRGSIVKTYSLPAVECKITTYPIFNREQELTMVIFYGVDIAKEKRLENLMFLSNQVTHEIHNPLQIIKWKMENIKNNLENWINKEYFRTKIDEIVIEIDRTVSIVKSLSTVSSKQKTEKKLISFKDIILDSLNRVKELNPRKKIVANIKFHSKKGPMFLADESCMKSVFTNLLQNSYQALEKVEDPHLGIEVVEDALGDIFQVRISDNGIGISQDLRNKIFSPFTTTKDPTKGKGLGLTICYNFIKEHGGNIFLANNNGNGTTFVVELPKLTSNYNDI